MGLTVGGQFLFKLGVNGLEIPAGVGTFTKFQICENIQTRLPTIEFHISDPTHLLHDIARLGEGSTVNVVFFSDYGFDTMDQAYQINFKVTGTSFKIDGNNLNYACNGIFDSVQYLGALVKESFKGTTKDVMGQLSEKCGLSYEGPDSTKDEMPWLPTRQTFSDFCHHLCDHGHASDKSVMSLGVTDRGKLIYKDLDSLTKQSAARIAYSGSPELIEQGIIPMSGFEVINMSGLGNFTYNYGSKIVQEKLTGNADVIEKFSTGMMSNFLNIDSGIKDLVKQVRSEYVPHEMSNQHEKFYDAEFQNKRGRSLFTNRIVFTTQNSSGLHLYDVVNVNPVLPGNNIVSDMLAGNYIVTAKTKYLSANKYAEKIEVMSQGSSTNTGSLVGPQTNPAPTALANPSSSLIDSLREGLNV